MNQDLFNAIKTKFESDSELVEAGGVLRHPEDRKTIPCVVVFEVDGEPDFTYSSTSEQYLIQFSCFGHDRDNCYAISENMIRVFDFLELDMYPDFEIEGFVRVGQHSPTQIDNKGYYQAILEYQVSVGRV